MNTAVFVLVFCRQFCCCVVKYELVTIVVIMNLKDIATVRVSLQCVGSVIGT